jgi:transcriptional/translational regulatory protein YebC/TACO1
MEIAIESGAEDIVINDDNSIDVVTSPENFFIVKDALLAKDLTPDHSEITMEPANRVELNVEDAEKFMKLIERLEDLDDTQDVYHNADISDEILSEL